MNVDDTGIVAAKNLKCQFHNGNCMTLTTGVFAFGKISAQITAYVRYGTAHTRSQFRKKYAS